LLFTKDVFGRGRRVKKFVVYMGEENTKEDKREKVGPFHTNIARRCEQLHIRNIVG
jgi:hypothetical protein